MAIAFDAADAPPGELRRADPPAVLADGYERETARLIRARLDLAIAFFLLFMGIVVLVERRLPGHERVVIAYGVEMTICLAALVAIRIPALELAARTIAVLCMTGIALAMLAISAACTARRTRSRSDRSA